MPSIGAKRVTTALCSSGSEQALIRTSRRFGYKGLEVRIALGGTQSVDRVLSLISALETPSVEFIEERGHEVVY
jgi:hypothetical protein